MKRYYEVLLSVYTIFLVYMMFYGCGRHPEFGFLQLNPFQSIKYFLNYHQFFSETFMVNIVGNIIVFIPYGWLGILDKRLTKLPLLAFLFITWICAIELTQYYTARGTADVDDVFLNTFGMLIGYIILQIVTKLNIANIRLELTKDYETISSY